MGCWHGHGSGHGCGPGYYGPQPRGWYGPVDECDWSEDVDWPRRCRFRERSGERGSRESSFEARLEDLREEMQRVEAALADLARRSSGGTTG